MSFGNYCMKIYTFTQPSHLELYTVEIKTYFKNSCITNVLIDSAISFLGLHTIEIKVYFKNYCIKHILVVSTIQFLRLYQKMKEYHVGKPCSQQFAL